jgi:DNA-binding NarL/FixJ family response regulator
MTATNAPIRILVVDDHPGFRAGLVAMVEFSGEMKVVAEASDCAQAIEAFKAHRPDITLMDLRLPDMSGVEGVMALRAQDPQCRVIVITTYDADEDIYRALQAGAKSYLLKEMTAEELRSAIRAVARGETPLPAQVAQRLASRLSRPALTRRELDMIRLIVRGFSNKEIASEFGITEDTVKGHLKHLFVKLGVKDRTQAAIMALQQGIIHLWNASAEK